MFSKSGIALRVILAAALASLCLSTAAAQSLPPIPANSVLGRLGSGNPGPAQAIPLTRLTGQLFSSMSGDCTITLLGVISCTDTNGVPFGYFATGTGYTNLTGLGTGVSTALGINVGTAGSPVVNGGALGTPSSATLTNGTGLPLSTGVTGILGQSNGGAGTITGALKGNGSGTVSQAACADLSNGGTACSQAYTASTFTPTITTTSTVGTPAYTIQVGSYEQIGRQVTARFTLVLSGWSGSPTGNVQIVLGALPAAANTSSDFGYCSIPFYSVSGLASTNYGIGGYITPNTNVITLQQKGNAATSAITAAQAGTSPDIQGFCTYHT